MAATPRNEIATAGQFERHAGNLAIGYGLPIFPCNPLNKHPIIGDRGGYKHATADWKRLEPWITGGYRNAMAGLPCGPHPEAGLSFFVLDVDSKSSDTTPSGFQSLDALEKKHGKLPASFRVRTGRNGRHIYLKLPPGVRLPNRNSDIAPGLDIKSAGGYVIAPGSVLASGKEYEPLDGRSFEHIEDAPHWLLFLAVFGKRRREQLAAIGVHGPDDLGGEPWSWVDRSRELLRLDRPKLQGELTEGRAESIRGYINKGISLEIEAVRGAEPGSRDTTVNNSALKIWSLIHGADELGVKADDIEEATFGEFSGAVAELGEEFARPEYAEEKWERCKADADARDLGHVGAPKPEEEFPDLLTNDEATRRLLEYCRDVSLEDMLHRGENALVAGMLFQGITGTIYGAWGTAKTFFAVDLGFSIAQGREWQGRRVTQAPVLYVSLEGNDGFRKRMLAATAVHGDPGDWFARLVPDVLLNKTATGDKGVQQIVEACRELERQCGVPVGLVVIDTKARATAGDDENSSADAGMYQRRTAAIAKATGAAVVTVHHSNRAGGYRGSSASDGGDDLIIRMEKGTQHKAFGEKVKDGTEGLLFNFGLKQVPLGINKHGETETSCVIERLSFQAKPVKDSAGARLLRSVFDELERQNQGETALMPETTSPGYRISIDAVRGAFVAAYIKDKGPETSKDTAGRTWRRVLRDELPDDFAATDTDIFQSRCPFDAME